MKRRNLLVIIAILAVVTLIFTACEDNNEELTKISDMLELDYSMVNLHVQTVHKGITLNNVFTSQSAVNGTLVTYSVEEMSTITTNSNGEFVVPSDMITKKSGSATVKNGKIIDQTGASVNIPTSELNASNLTFKSSYFSATNSSVGTLSIANVNDQVFTATVSDIKGFTGNANFDGKDMTVKVAYAQKINVIQIEYTSNAGAQVKINYTFI